MTTKELTYKGFKITIEKVLRRKFTNGRNGITNSNNGLLTEVKQYHIKYLGEVSNDIKEMNDHIIVEEFKSLPKCKKHIDDGGFNSWIELLK
jgi:hypothetical protein